MDICMTGRTKCDQVFGCVLTGVAAEPLVMNFQVEHATAGLAFPTIASEYLHAELSVCLVVEPRRGEFLRNLVHDATASAAWLRNARLCSPGRNLKNRTAELSSASGSPLSRLAPARKSAQIISRQ
jgi:hypothetical protein